MKTSTIYFLCTIGVLTFDKLGVTTLIAWAFMLIALHFLHKELKNDNRS